MWYTKINYNQIFSESQCFLKKFQKFSEKEVMMAFIQQIDHLLKTHAMTAGELALRLGLNRNVVTDWRKGNSNPSAATLVKISQLFHVSVDWLLDVDTPRTLKVFDQYASAGLGNYLGLLDTSYEEIEVASHRVPHRADFGIRIKGDSMEPLILDGAIVWVKSQIQLQNGEIGIFVLNGDALCKKLKINDQGKPALYSVNEAYPPISLSQEDIVNIVGKVLI